MFGFGKEIIYILLSVFVGIPALLLIPKNSYKKFFLYGLIFGASGDILIAFTGRAINLFEYKHLGIFNLFNVFSFWTPITWMFVFSIFFFMLPVKKVFLGIYLVAFTFSNYSVGLILNKLGLFEYIGWFKYFAPVVFFVWYSFSAWIYMRLEKVSLK